ncbi:MAG: carbohydrate deacetylase [Thermoguttaceae bacterium]
MQTNLIINADDAGIARCVNDAIVAGALAGKITAASLMANMPLATDAAERFARETPQLDVGLHFCLTSGRPLSSPNDVTLLVNEDGKFKLGFVGLLRNAAGKNREKFLAQVERELVAQLDWCDKHKVALRFIDGHQHVHIIPEIVELVQREAARRRLFVRIPDEPLGSWSRIFRRARHWLGGGIVKKLILSSLSRRAQNQTPNLPLIYHGVLDTGKMLFAAWDALLRSPHTRGKTLLVNIHPATEEAANIVLNELDCSDADYEFLRSPNRIAEYRVLETIAWNELIADCGVTIVRFGV